MSIRLFSYLLFTSLLLISIPNTAQGDAVKIVAADFHNTDGSYWAVSVSLQHADTGWDHFADSWRLVDPTGKVLGERVLAHPHVDEQAFTRQLDRVLLPEGLSIVFVEAHDNVHGWAAQRLKVDLSQARAGRLMIKAP